MKNIFNMNGPIPGENFTSNTKNYAWHRPPEYSTTDDVLDYVAKIFSKEEAIASTVTMMEIGIDIATITDLFVTKGVAEGKWSIDMGLVVAGPIAHMLVIMAKSYGVPVKLGLSNEFNGPTSMVFNTIKKDLKKLGKNAKADMQEQIAGAAEQAKAKNTGGFMQGPTMEEEPEDIDNPEEEQMEMM
jgi:hypothetical protein